MKAISQRAGLRRPSRRLWQASPAVSRSRILWHQSRPLSMFNSNRARGFDGRFLVREIFSRGGMASIYRAEDMLDEHREVVLKVPLTRVESDPPRSRAYRTRRRSVSCSLIHILVRFRPVTGEKSSPVYSDGISAGCTLDYLGYEIAALAEDDALKIVSPVCEARGLYAWPSIIHRDLKPANIMICRDRTLRVMDFGLASPAIRRRNPLAKLTAILGTPEYMAPEQVEHGPIDRTHRCLRHGRDPLRNC